MKFKQHLRIRGYPKTVIERSLSGVNFADRPSPLTQKKKAKERILPFATTYEATAKTTLGVRAGLSLTYSPSLILYFCT